MQNNVKFCQFHRGHRAKRLLAGVLTAVLTLVSANITGVAPTYATSLEELRQQKRENDEKLSSLSDARKQLEKSLGNMNSELYSVSNSISELEEQIEEKEYEIAEAQLLLEDTQEMADEQYANMKLRIQFMYENGGTFSWTTLLEAGSFAEFLTRAQYMMDINAADQQMMDEYEETLALIAEYQETLARENEELNAAKEELASRQNSLLASISGAKNQISTTDGEIANAQQVSKDLAAKIAAMEEYERRLNAQKTSEASSLSEARLQQIAQQEAELLDTRYVVTPAEGEEELLAALIYCEAGGEPYAGQVAVATVTLNRVCSSYFPNTITGVIYQSRQYTPVSSGKLALVLENGLTTESCRNAAREVLAGGYSGNWLYFCVDNGSIPGTVIGKQVFY
ncbi:MAG: cell wall hydrolase [Lachnospiraceae bacterium]|nr:cell wall hydrolase [Lachnospiraceae bacterium]